MKTLAIDFSTDRRAAHLDFGQRGPATIFQFNRQVGALALIETAFEKAGAERSELERIVLGLGPGSYTGIRSAIALAQGWALGTEVELVGAPSVDAIACGAAVQGDFVVVLDAQRGEFYTKYFRFNGDGASATSELRIQDRAAVEAAAKSGARLVGPEVVKDFGGGDIVHPDPVDLVRVLAKTDDKAMVGELEPIYLRPTEFKKAPPARLIE